jgi:uncharacterized protein YecE (DUF72 family)
MTAIEAPIRIGLSGWSYPEFRAAFYKGVPQRRWLEHCAAHFNTMEVNGTFYRRQPDHVVAGWRERTPDGFVFSVKGHRHVTHNKKLNDCEDQVIRMRDGVAGLQGKLACVLWQLPPQLGADHDRLKGFAALLARHWPGPRHAVEFRHRSWFTGTTAAILEDARIANVISDAARWDRFDAVTADLVYLRLHGAEQTYVSEYGEDGLGPWAARIRNWRREGRAVFAYFDNTAEGAAPRDALLLRRLLGQGADSA